MDKFVCIKDLYEYIEDMKTRMNKELRDDLKILADYVLDNIFEHEEETMNTDAFRSLPLRKVGRYNQKYFAYKANDDFTNPTREVAFNHLLDLYNFISNDWCTSSDVGILYYSPYNSGFKISPICDIPYTYYHTFENNINSTQCNGIVDVYSMNLAKFIPLDKYEGHKDNISVEEISGLPWQPFLPLSIPRIHPEEDFYLRYFVKSDPCLNRLRKLILALVREQVYRYSIEIDDDDSDKRDSVRPKLEMLKTLIGWCRNLHSECEVYLIHHDVDVKIPLKL